MRGGAVAENTTRGAPDDRGPGHGVPDADLIAAARTGTQEAFGALVERYQSFVFACAYAVSRSPSVSEEIAQEAFLTAWRRLPDLGPPYHFRGWLFAIVRNLTMRWQRDERVRAPAGMRPLAADDQIKSGDPSPLDRMITRQEERTVSSALGDVPEAYRLPLVLHYGEQQSVAEVARTLGLSDDTVRQRLVRGRRLLQARVALVESALRKVVPGKGFVASVIAVLDLGASRAQSAAPPRRATRMFAVAVAVPALLSSALVGMALRSSERVDPAKRSPPPIDRRASFAEALPPAFRATPASAAMSEPKARPLASAPAVIYTFDFEDGILPALFEHGHIVATPPGSASRSCLTGTLEVTWPNSYLVTLGNYIDPFLHHSDAAVLSFDYWIGHDYHVLATDNRITALGVSIRNASQGQNYSFYLHDYTPEAWGHLELPLAAFKPNRDRSRHLEAGDAITSLSIGGGKVAGKPFLVDNIRIVARQSP